MADLKISQLTAYTTPVDTDVFPINDTTLSTTKKLSWANLKATLKTYLDTLYSPVFTTSAGLASLLSDETGSGGGFMRATAPSMTTPTMTSPVINGNPSGTFVTQIANGGTGQTAAQAALDALLPAQGGNSGKVLSTNGTTASWGGALTPTGSIMAWTTTSAPTGFLLCDGSAVSRTTYATLFGIVSTTFGTGDGSTTFNVPNLKGKVIVGFNASETEFDAMGETGGEKTHTLTVAEMPAHTHNYPSTAGGAGNAVPTLSDAGAHNNVTDSKGGDGAHNNLQPYMALTYIIKT